MASAVSGMLSNTAETKPRPIATTADAGGSCSTGIIDAMVTSESRKTEPLRVSGMTSQSGRRIGIDSRIAAHTAAPRKGKLSAISGKVVLMKTLVAMANARIMPTMPTRAQSTRVCSCACLMIGE